MPFTPIRIVAALSCALAASAQAQSFNIDFDQVGSPASLGGGPPSSAFGAASGQTGMWNFFNINPGPIPLFDLSGAATAVTLTASATFGFTTLGFNNATNSGDYRLLMNDASQVGTVTQGGMATYTFNNMANGAYQVYTYAAPPQGTPGSTLVIVNGVVQFSAGGSNNNAFVLGQTHVVHNVLVTGNTLTITVNDPLGDGLPAYINGIQIIVPTPGSALALATLGALGLRRRR